MAVGAVYEALDGGNRHGLCVGPGVFCFLLLGLSFFFYSFFQHLMSLRRNEERAMAVRRVFDFETFVTVEDMSAA
jgi:hypothetical protein